MIPNHGHTLNGIRAMIDQLEHAADALLKSFRAGAWPESYFRSHMDDLQSRLMDARRVEQSLYQQAAYQQQMAAMHSQQALLQGQMQAQQNAISYQQVGTVFGRIVRPEPLVSADEFGEITGHRIWRVKAGYVTSVHMQGFIWLPKRAMRTRDEIEDYGPHGLHAWKTEQQAVDYALSYASPNPDARLILGRAHLWGTVVHHECGWRAEYARIIGFDDVIDFCDPYHSESRRKQKKLAALRVRYGLEPA